MRALRPNCSMSKAWSHVPASRYFFFLNFISLQTGHLIVMLPVLAWVVQAIAPLSLPNNSQTDPHKILGAAVLPI